MIRLVPTAILEVVALTEDIRRHVVLVHHEADRDRPTVQAATSAIRAAVECLDQPGDQKSLG